MVIDDLADRPHHCTLLLDQTYNRTANDYTHLISDNCPVLTGQHYGILRREFSCLRRDSLLRRKNTQLRNILITMGGTDHLDTSGKILRALTFTNLTQNCTITVVMGAQAPHLENTRQLAQQMPWHCRVMVEVSNMAELMAASDLAIGAVGGTA